MNRGFINPERAYSAQESALMMDLHARKFKTPRIAADLAAAGFTPRNAGAIRRAIARRCNIEPRRPDAPRFGRNHVGPPLSENSLRDRKRLELADDRFCKALQRERPRTGISHELGTDNPHALTPPLAGRYSACGWVW